MIQVPDAFWLVVELFTSGDSHLICGTPYDNCDEAKAKACKMSKQEPDSCYVVMEAVAYAMDRPKDKRLPRLLNY